MRQADAFSNQAYLSSLRQEPEFADRSAGDIVSRLSVDTGILGESVTSNLSDGLRSVPRGFSGGQYADEQGFDFRVCRK